MEFPTAKLLLSEIAAFIADKSSNNENSYKRIEQLVKYGFETFKHTLSDRDRGELYYYASVCCHYFNDFTNQLTNAQAAVSLLQDSNDIELLNYSNHECSFALWQLGKYGDMVEYLVQEVELCRKLKNTILESAALNNLGLVYRILGDYISALSYFEQAAVAEASNHNTKVMAGIIGNIGTIYHYQNKKEIALEYYQRSLELKEEIHDNAMIITTLGNIAVIHADFGNYEQALAMMFRALALLEKLGNSVITATHLSSIGNIYRQMGCFEEALGYLQKAMDMVLQIDKATQPHHCFGLIADLYLDENYNGYNPEIAKTFLLKALELCAESKEYASATSYYQMLSNLEEKAGNYEQAYQYLQIYYERNACLNNDEIENKLQSMHIRHRIDQLQTETQLERLRNIELAGTNAHLAELNTEINTILGIVSNHLKSPLESIKLSSEYLSLHAQTLAAKEIFDSASSILQSSSFMFDIISDLLEISALESGKIKIELALSNISGIIFYAADSIGASANEKDIKLNIILDDNLPNVLIDEQRFREVCGRLFSNIFKYSQNRSLVEISAQILQDASILQIIFHAYGYSLAIEDLPKIFYKFQKFSASITLEDDTSGLGLAIVKKLIELMNGRIWCEPAEDKGIAFIIELPIAKV